MEIHIRESSGTAEPKQARVQKDLQAHTGAQCTSPGRRKVETDPNMLLAGARDTQDKASILSLGDGTSCGLCRKAVLLGAGCI